MSRFTTELRYICEKEAGLDESVGYNDIGTVLHACHSAVLGNYPIFDESYRETLDTKILKHYYTREICEETVGLWKLRINTRLNEIMPYYNKLYQSELIHFNPLYDVDITTSHTKVEDSSGTNVSKLSDMRNESKVSENESEKIFENVSNKNDSINKDSNVENSFAKSTSTKDDTATSSNVENNSVKTDSKIHKDMYSDTPQGGITGLESGTYLTNARIVDDSNNSGDTTLQKSSLSGNRNYQENGSGNDVSTTKSNEVVNSSDNSVGNESNKNSLNEVNSSKIDSTRNDEHSINNTEDYLQHVQGKSGGMSMTKMIMEYRDSFLNIDMMIIEKLSDLFFGLWE